MKRIYISPSNQTSNLYATGNTNEGTQCQAIGELVGEMLQENYADIEVRVAPITQKALDRANEARNWGSDLMVCIHTNASGRTTAGQANGTLGIYYKGDYKTLTLSDAEIQKRRDFAQLMVEKVSQLTGINRGVTTNQQTELVFCGCYGALIEMEFHDNAKGSDFIQSNHESLANALVEAIAVSLGLEKKSAEQPEEGLKENEFYAVQVGAYKNLNNAKRQRDKIRNLGAGAYIILKNTAEKTYKDVAQ